MWRMHRLLWAVVVASSWFALRTVAQTAGAGHETLSVEWTYDIVELEQLPGAYSTWGVAVNNRGQVAGTADPPLQAVRWHRGGVELLETLGGSLSRAYGINRRGQIVGISTLPGDEEVRGMVWSRHGLQDIGLLPGGEVGTVAYSINDWGLVVGLGDVATESVHAVLWHRLTGLIDLGPLSLGGDPARTEPVALNNRMQFVGHAETADQHEHAFLWQRGEMIDLGTLGGSYSYANDINDRGEIVGYSYSQESADPVAVIWRNGEIESLGTLGDIGTPGGTSTAIAINNRGTIIGYGRDEDRTYQAVIWRDGVMYSLHDLIPAEADWRFSVPHDINDRGQILVDARVGDEREFGSFLLTPRPVFERTAPLSESADMSRHLSGDRLSWPHSLERRDGAERAR